MRSPLVAIVVALVTWRAGICAAQPATEAAPPPSPPRYTGDPLVRAPHTRSWEVGSSIDLERRTTVRRGTSSMPAEASYDRTNLTVMASLDVGRLGLLELQVPISTLRFREPATGARRDDAGLGDTSLHLHRYRPRGSGRWSSGFFLGLRIPTGGTAATPVVGQMLPTVVQRGTGTLDPEFGACLHLQLGDIALGACDHGKISLYSASNGYRESYEFHARLLAAMPLFGGHASAQAGLLYERRSEAHLHGEALPSTGHRQVFAEASVWLRVVRGLSLRSTVELPVVQSVQGTQLTDTLRIMAGLSYDFDRL